MGLNSLRDMAGVFISSSSWFCVRLFAGVSTCLVRLVGVCAGGPSDFRFGGFEASFEGGGSLPERMSRTLLYCLYFAANDCKDAIFFVGLRTYQFLHLL